MAIMYNFKDFRQSAIGSFVAIIIFYAIRGGNPFYFNEKIGLAITVILAWIYFNGFKMKNKKIHFLANGAIAFGVSALMANIFGLILLEEIFTMRIFGSLVMVGTWVAFPVGMLFDRYNFVNPLRRYYVRGR